MSATKCLQSLWREAFNSRSGLVLLLVLLAGGLRAADLNPFLRGKWGSAQEAWQVVVKNNVAYVANDADGLRIFTVTNPANPVLLATYKNTNSEPVLGVSLGTGASLNYAYLAVGAGGVDVINISNPSSPQFVGNIPVEVDFLDLQANAVLVSPFGGSLYIADDFTGIKIFKISNPTNLDATNLLGAADTYGTAYGLLVNPGNFDLLYVANGDGGLAKVNISDTANPETTANATLPGNARNVAAPNAFTAYVACEEGGLQIVDTTTFAPKREFATTTPAWGVAYQNNTVYVACGEGGVQLISVATTTPTRYGGYYSGFTNSAYGLTLAGTNVFVAAGGLQILNTNLLANPQKLGDYSTSTNVLTADESERSDVRAVGAFGAYALVADNNYDLSVINVSNPANPKQAGPSYALGQFDLPNGMFITNNYAYLALGLGGMDIWDLTDVSNLLSYDVNIAGNANAVVVEGSYAYIAAADAGLIVAEISDPNFAAQVSSHATGGNANGLATANGYVYLADGQNKFSVIDVNDPMNPLGVGTVATLGVANDVALAGHYAFVADGSAGLTVIDIADPLHPTRVANLNVGEVASGIVISGEFAYLCDGLASLLVIDISNPLNPRLAGSNTSFDGLYGASINSNRVYVAAGNGGVQILNLFRPLRFRNLNPVTIITNTTHVFVSGPTNGQACRIQRSTNLVSTNNWQDWQTITFANTNFVELVDTNYPANKQRFYRAIAP